MIGTLLLAAQVVLWHSYREDEQRGLEAAVVQWNRGHPDQAVDPVAVPHDGFAYKIEAAIPHGQGPDVWIFAHERIADWSHAQLLMPLSGVDTQPFLPATVESLRQGGQLYGLPLAFKTLALYCRSDLVPKPPTTIDEIDPFCRAQRSAGRFCLAYEAASFYHHAPWLHGEGGTILDPTGRPHLATAPAVRSLRFVRKLVEQGWIPEETTGALVGELFNQGRAACTINGPWFRGEIQAGVAVTVLPLPKHLATGVRAAPLLTVEAGLVSAQAQRPEAALAFLVWLAGPEGARVRARIGHQPVAVSRLWEEPELASDPLLTPFRAQLDASVPMVSSPAMRATWEPAQQALRRVLRGAFEPEAALRDADRQIALALAPRPRSVSPIPYVWIGGAGALALLLWAVRRMRLSPRGPAIAYAYLAPSLLALLLLALVPFAVGAGISLFDYDGATWRFVGGAQFRQILANHDLGDPLNFYFTLAITLLWTFANVTLHVAIGVLLALLLRDPWLRLRGLYRVLLVVPWAVPNYITALIWKGMFHRQFGAINHLLAVLGIAPVSWFSHFWTAFTANLVTNVWLGFPFMMVVTLGALARLPRELEEAALLDGASRGQLVRRIILPFIAPQLVPAVVLGAVWTFNMFNVVFLVSSGEPDGATDILVSQAYRWAFTRGHRYGYAAAFAVLIFVVLWLQSRWVRRFQRETA